jgi:hypothetical protein
VVQDSSASSLGLVNNAFIRKSTTYYTFNSVKGSPYTLSSDGNGRVADSKRKRTGECRLTKI